MTKAINCEDYKEPVTDNFMKIKLAMVTDKNGIQYLKDIISGKEIYINNLTKITYIRDIRDIATVDKINIELLAMKENGELFIYR